jgi:hypothetical protein
MITEILGFMLVAGGLYGFWLLVQDIWKGFKPWVEKRKRAT